INVGWLRADRAVLATADESKVRYLVDVACLVAPGDHLRKDVMSLDGVGSPGMRQRNGQSTSPIFGACILNGQVRGLEERVAWAATCKISRSEANPPELLLHEVKEFARAAVAAKDGRQVGVEDSLARSGVVSRCVGDE